MRQFFGETEKPSVDVTDQPHQKEDLKGVSS